MGGNVRDPQPSNAAALIAEILGLAEKLREHWEAPCAEHGVSASRFAILSTIHQGASEGIAQTELARGLNLSESNVSVLIEALRKSGLLHRLRSKADRRRSVLLLTEAGQELVTLLTTARNVVADALMHDIPTQQLADLRRLLTELDGCWKSAAGTALDDVPTASSPSKLRKAS